jgi:hypothetical protein
LIPMFLISKYNNTGMLWWIYGLINGGLLVFIFNFLYGGNRMFLVIPLLAVAAALVLFANFCYRSYRLRIRKKVDAQMKVSLLAVLMMLLPMIVLLLIIAILVLWGEENIRLLTAYGFIIFFGWITVIILGMTFKTLPFIVWNKVYHLAAGKGKTPNPKDLFSNAVFKWMMLFYIFGFLLFTVGLLLEIIWLLQAGAVLLLFTALLYNRNIIKLLLHKPAV